MACATLKRSLDFDPVHNHVNPTKRQRCAPMVISPSSSPPGRRSESYNSVFAGVCPSMSPEMMAASIREEIRRLHRKKLLHFHPKLVESASPSETSSTLAGSPSSSVSSVFSANTPDKPLFTFRQVGLICERLMAERENQIREEYDRLLSMKLSEQYEAFVKFSNDQLHKKFDAGAVPSFLAVHLRSIQSKSLALVEYDFDDVKVVDESTRILVHNVHSMYYKNYSMVPLPPRSCSQ